MRAEKVPDRATHFSHRKMTGCPLVDATHEPYTIFKALSRTSPAEARAVKQYALDHLENVFARARQLCPGLIWNEFLSLLETATQERIWELKDFDPRYLPYVLLTCTHEFKANLATKRPRSIFFALEPHPERSTFWHQPGGPKQYIWRVERATLHIDKIFMDLDEVQIWYRRKARQILDI